MLMGTRVSKCFSIIYLDYIRFIGEEAAGLYFHILWMSDKSLGKPLTPSYIIGKTSIKKESVKTILQTLLAAGLITRTRVDGLWTVVIQTPKYLTKKGKIRVAERLFNEDLISEDEKIDMIKYINKRHEHDSDELTPTDQSKVINFETEKNPDTGESLVEFYYRTLSRAFGAKYVSRNAVIEIKNLKDCMKKNGDTPEMTRDFFAWIIARAKQKGKFEQVSSLGLYPELRKHAYNAIVTGRNVDGKFAPEVERSVDIIVNMQAVFDIYVGKGFSKEEIEERMNNSFDKQAVDDFLKEKFEESNAN